MAEILIDDVLLREPNLATPAKKPVGNVVVDWNNPIAKDITCLYMHDNTAYAMNMADTSGLNLQRRPTYGSAKVVPDGGMGSATTAEAHYHTTSSTPLIDAGTGDLTVLTTFTDDTGDKGWLLHQRNNTGFNESLQVIINGYYVNGAGSSTTEVGTFYVGALDTSAGYARGVKASSVLTGKTQTFVCVRRSNVWNLYTNGELIASYDATTNISDVSNSIDNSALGGFAEATYFGSNYIEGVIHNTAGWLRALRDDEAKSLSIDPYQILKPAGSAKQLNFISQVTTTEEVLVDDVLLREPNLATPAKKPVGNVEIDWNHPLAEGLVGAWLVSNENPRNLCHPTNGAPQYWPLHANASIETSLHGSGVYSSRTQVYGLYGSNSNDGFRNILGGATSATATIVMTATAGGTGNAKFLQVERQFSFLSSTTEYFSIEVRSGDLITTSLSIQTASPVSFNDGELMVASARWDAALDDANIFVNGVSQAMATPTADNSPTELNPSAYGTYEALSHGTFGTPEPAYMNGHFVFVHKNRFLSDDELKSLHADPYQILKPA